MKRLTLGSLFAISLTIQSAWAMHHETATDSHPQAMQHDGHNMNHAEQTMHTHQIKTMQNFSEAEVKRVDMRQGKITLKHGMISEIDMPPMTMMFSTQNPAILEGLQRGDKVQFRADSNMNLLDIIKK